MELTKKQYDLIDVLEKGASADSWHDEGNLYELGLIITDRVLRSRVFTAARKTGPGRDDLLNAIAEVKKRRNGDGSTTDSRYQKESLTHLLADTIAPPMQLFEGLMHEGMLLFGGKSKRGKSWLMFDLAMSLSVKRAGLRHFACPEARPVLYLALEDGRARLQGRAKAIQPNVTTVNGFDLMYNFPPLSDGGLEMLTKEIAQNHYGLVVIDVLAKLEQPNGTRGEKNYHDIYEMFTPLQELRKQHPFCLAMLTHLRKQEADDVFDSLLGSVAYQGAQDVLWVLERKPKDDFAFLHIRDKDAEDKVIAMRFLDGHWEYVGEGDAYEVSRDQRKIMKVLAEEKREMGIEEIRKAAEFPENKYGYVRKMLITMVKDDLIHHASYGKYSATVRGVKEVEVEDYEVDERGDRVPF
jgi:AAA domain